MIIDTDVLAAVQESLRNIDSLANEQALVILAAVYSYLLKTTQGKLELLWAEKEKPQQSGNSSKGQ